MSKKSEYERIAHSTKPRGTIGWFILSIIPIVNLVWYWRVSKVIALHEDR